MSHIKTASVPNHRTKTAISVVPPTFMGKKKEAHALSAPGNAGETGVPTEHSAHQLPGELHTNFFGGSFQPMAAILWAKVASMLLFLFIAIDI